MTFNNGWQNNSWGPTHNTNNPIHSGTNALCLAPSGGWQAMRFIRADTDTRIYTNITLWINGGPTGGQAVGIDAVVGGTGQSRIPVGINNKLPTNSWLQVTLSLASLGAANVTNFEGIEIWSTTGNTQAPFYVDDVTLIAASKPAVVHVGINATNRVRTVDARLFSVNTAAWDGDLDTTYTTSVMNGMNNQSLRWPGGSWGDGYHWTNEPDSEGYVNRNWGSFSTNFIHVATNTHAQAFIIANYGSSTPQEAAFGVAMFNVTNQCHFKYWEIGNEIYGTGWEEDSNTNLAYFGQEVPHDPWTYAMRFKDYYSAMKAVDPTIKLGAVALPDETSYANNANHPAVNPVTGTTNNGWTAVMLNTMRTNGVTPDFLIEHKYAPGNGDTYNLLWTSTWASDAASLRRIVNDYLGGAATNIELVDTEFGPSGDKQYVSLVGGLFYADSIGQILQTEFNALLWWDLRNGPYAITNSDNALYGWRTNSAGYYLGDGGCINSTAVPPNRYPSYYCMELMQYFARGGDTVVTATNDYELLGTYAVQRTNGSLTLLVINKSSSSNLTANIKIQGYAVVSNTTVQTYSYGMPQDNAAATGVGSPDIASGVLSGVSSNFNCAFPPYSATVLVFSPVVSWVGSATNDNWDIATTPNWNVLGTSSVYQDGSQVVFGDNAATNCVILTANVAPASVLVNNSVTNYTFGGPGAITNGTLTKTGTGTLTILNTNTCNLVVSGGTLQIGNGGASGALGSGTVEVDATLAFNLSINATVTNTLSGAGMVVKLSPNTLTLSGVNTYTGGTLVTNGTLLLGNSGALNNSSGVVTVSGTGCVDFNNQQPTALACTISGAGFNGLGTLVQNSGQNNAYGPASLTLAGSATIGGTNRWDLRNGANTLNSPTNAYTLTKVGPGLVSLVNTLVSSNLGDLNLLGGTLAYELNTTSLGNPTNTIRLGGGTKLELWSAAVPLNKNIVCSNGATIEVDSGNALGQNVIAGPVTLAGGTTALASAAFDGLYLSNTISGPGALTVQSQTFVYLAASNTFTGPLTVSDGNTANGGLGTRLSLIGNGSISQASQIYLQGSVPGQVYAGYLDASGRVDATLTLGANQVLRGDNGVIRARQRRGSRRRGHHRRRPQQHQLPIPGFQQRADVAGRQHELSWKSIRSGNGPVQQPRRGRRHADQPGRGLANWHQRRADRAGGWRLFQIV